MYKFPLGFNEYTEIEANAIKELFIKGRLTQGEVTNSYEKLLSKYFKTKYAIALNSGSSANLLMLSALLYSNDSKLSLKKGDEVIVPAVSWITTYSPIIQLGLIPKVVDIDPFTFNIDTNAIKRAISKRTKCIFAVNLLGCPCDFKELKDICNDYGLILLEDNCESMGAKFNNQYTGTFSLMSSQSTYMSHHISTIEGGFILTDNDYFNDLLRSLRSHGWARYLNKKSNLYKDTVSTDKDEILPEDFLFLLPGYNLRTTEINSQLGILQLPKLDKIIKSRRETSASFREILEPFKSEIYTQSDPFLSSCFGFSLITKCKELLYQLKISLNKNGFQTRPIVTGNILRHPVSKFFPNSKIQMINADKLHFQGTYISNYFSSKNEALDAFSSTLNSLF